MKYPNVNELFYWKDYDGNVVESVCRDIKIDPDGHIETCYAIYVTGNGGGIFVNESSIVDPESDEVKNAVSKSLKSKLLRCMYSSRPRPHVEEFYDDYYDKYRYKLNDGEDDAYNLGFDMGIKVAYDLLNELIESEQIL